jgi:hypothetical protein
MVSLVQLISLIFSLEVVDLVSVSTSFLIYIYIYLITSPRSSLVS